MRENATPRPDIQFLKTSKKAGDSNKTSHGFKGVGSKFWKAIAFREKMKLTIGDKYVNETEQYKEELEIVGCNAEWLKDAELTKGDIFCPKSKDMVEVRIINSIRGDYFHTEISLKDLQKRWTKK